MLCGGDGHSGGEIIAREATATWVRLRIKMQGGNQGHVTTYTLLFMLDLLLLENRNSAENFAHSDNI